MPKEDRSDWVAVESDVAAANAEVNKIKPAQSAYLFFQKAATESVKAEHMAANGGKFEVGLFSKLMRDKWVALTPEDKKPYEDLAMKDQFRFRSESHAADIAAIERRERLQRERDTLMLDDEGGTKRSTRGGRAKKERKKERKEKRKLKHELKKKKKKSFCEEDGDDDDEDFEEGSRKKSGDTDAMNVDEEEDSSSDDFSVQSDDSSSSEDSEGNPKKKKAKPAPRQLSQKQIERRQRLKEEKEQKEAIIAGRQEDIRKEKAGQAKKRLEFLLKQSNIFSHFGAVKEDNTKFGINPNEKKAIAAPGLNRRES
ncbi:MAG: hypothetical protein SGARI_001707, partial [Bacillariaceae sp.]